MRILTWERRLAGTGCLLLLFIDVVVVVVVVGGFPDRAEEM